MKTKLFLLPILSILFFSCKSDDDNSPSTPVQSTTAVEIEIVTNGSSNTVQLSLSGSNPIINWGDGNTQKLDGTNSTILEHTYASSAQAYTIEILDSKLQSLGVEKNDNDIIKYVKFVNTPSLRFVRLLDVKSIYSLDFSASPVLQEVYITKSALTSLDLTNNKSVQSVKLISNPELAGLKLSSTLKVLGLDSNPKLSVSDLGLSQLTSLEDLLLYNMELTNIDLGANIAISTLDVSNNKLTSIDVSKLSNLEVFKSNDNQLTSITIGTANAKLKSIESSYNKLEVASLDAIYELLPTRGTDEGAAIDISGNPGVDSSNETLAVSKNWAVVK